MFTAPTAGKAMPPRVIPERPALRYLPGMFTGLTRTARYARAWLGTPTRVVEDEITLDRGGVPVPATLVQPRGATGPGPAWVVMHGITRPGRAHAQLVRFTHSLAEAGILSIVPEVPEWRELQLAPGLSVPTVAAAIDGLRDSGVARDGPVGVVGFSFGAPHAIAASAHPRLADEVGATCGFGGYASIGDAFHFMMTGEHRHDGVLLRHRPDPYGRWIVAANYLTLVPGHEPAVDVADALRTLARHAGDVGTASWDPRYDPVIDRLRAGIAPDRRPTFDLFAPRSDAVPDPEAAGRMAANLTEAARAAEPAIDPSEQLAEVRCPVHLLHGRGDHLIPFSECARLAAALPRADVRQTVTRLFGHSGQDPVPLRTAGVELPRFVRALGRVLAAV